MLDPCRSLPGLARGVLIVRRRWTLLRVCYSAGLFEVPFRVPRSFSLHSESKRNGSEIHLLVLLLSETVYFTCKMERKWRKKGSKKAKRNKAKNSEKKKYFEAKWRENSLYLLLLWSETKTWKWNEAKQKILKRKEKYGSETKQKEKYLGEKKNTEAIRKICEAKKLMQNFNMWNRSETNPVSL